MFELANRTRNNNQPLYYNPFREMEELERQFFGNPFGSFFRGGDIAAFSSDITDQGESYLLEADLPGFAKEDIHLDINGDMLSINAERHSEHEEKEKRDRYVRCERSYGKYTRQFDVSMVDTESIKAKYENGVLRVTLPKKNEKEQETKHLEIE